MIQTLFVSFTYSRALFLSACSWQNDELLYSCRCGVDLKQSSTNYHLLYSIIGPNFTYYSAAMPSLFYNGLCTDSGFVAMVSYSEYSYLPQVHHSDNRRHNIYTKQSIHCSTNDVLLCIFKGILPIENKRAI